MKERICNFSSGPAALPLPVLERVRDELLSYHGIGMSVMEISHRSKEFMEIIQNAEKGVIDILNVPENYTVLFLQGGASLQFCMIPMNLAKPDETVDLIQSGSWSKKAGKEIQKIAKLNIAGSTEDKNFTSLPQQEQLKLTPDAAYVHMTSNNTIYGTQFKTFPHTESTLVADMSSDIFSRNIDVQNFGLIFAGAQKNLGPAGVTLVIIRNDLMDRASDELPTMLQYRTHAQASSLYNTPPTFAIYVLWLVTEWVKQKGGLHAIEKMNQEKADMLYNTIGEDDFYYCPVLERDRSNMNVVFRIRGNDEEMEKKFISNALQNNISGIKGHRSVGGLRASIYNAITKEDVSFLIDFMIDFKKKNS